MPRGGRGAAGPGSGRHGVVNDDQSGEPISAKSGAQLNQPAIWDLARRHWSARCDARPIRCSGRPVSISMTRGGQSSQATTALPPRTPTPGLAVRVGGLSPQGKRGKTWTEFPLILAAGLWHLARDYARGEIHRAVVVAHRGCRYLALWRRPRPAWLGAQRGDWAMAAGNLTRTRCGGSGRGCRIGRVASRQGAWPPTRPRDRRSSPTRGARGVTAGQKRAAGQGRWARLRAAWRGE